MPPRRFSAGAEVLPDGRTHLRVWAPARGRVMVVHGEGRERSVPLPAEPGAAGMFAGFVDGLRAGDRYAFRLDDDPHAYPDPASRFQPDGPHGPSEVIDPATFTWTDAGWRGIAPRNRVIYELHLGTFTPEGTYAAAAERLPHLADLGVTLIELMPVAEFAGRFGWGYDGVDLWAPSHLYGRPDDLRRFVDRAHALGVGVILDVVYNHFGPDGNYLAEFSADYFTDRYANEWGAAINFDGPGSGPVRDLCVENAAYWISEFHLDGLRLDATQQIFDASPEHLVAAVGRRARETAGERVVFVVAENEPQEARLARPAAAGGHGLDALWNDDFHHTARVALTGHDEAYYSDYHGTPQELLSALIWGTLFQGQRYAWQKQPRGTPAFDLPLESFVLYLENHDQVANTIHGARLATAVAPGLLRALTAATLLAPSTPMLFQGQEFGSTRPFLYFADHGPELRAKVEAGRQSFLAQFPSAATPAARAALRPPADERTFTDCKLDWSERERHGGTLALHRDLLRLRRSAPFATAARERMAGAVLGPATFVLRFFGDGDRLLVVNLGRDFAAPAVAEPLLAPPAGQRWGLAWSSEDPRYGGGGTAPVDTDDGLRFPGCAAIVLAPERRGAETSARANDGEASDA
ncbi:MAG TPA: malto-oligosyltrehalose trehalohydrolase [Polyangia bacterium]|nr:malto-oligosyltrehalose trehalohydrolase [Polyangia bacterium]